MPIPESLGQISFKVSMSCHDWCERPRRGPASMTELRQASASSRQNNQPSREAVTKRWTLSAKPGSMNLRSSTHRPSASMPTSSSAQ